MLPPLLAPATRAVIFDAVGTLLFPNPGAPVVYAAYAARHGADCGVDLVRTRMTAAYAAEEEIDRSAGWVTSEEREGERWRRIVAATLVELPDPEACFRDLYEHFARPDAWTVNPEAAEVFHELSARGLALGLASNYDARLRRVIAGRHELEPIRGHVIVSSEVGYRKPSSRFYAAVLQNLGISDPREVTYVGDDYQTDYLGASGAGLAAVLYDDRDRTPSAVRVRRLPDLLG
jgi:putative hydrolase of the HAD superfamily